MTHTFPQFLKFSIRNHFSRVILTGNANKSNLVRSHINSLNENSSLLFENTFNCVNKSFRTILQQHKYHTTQFLSRTILQAIRNSRNRRQDMRTIRKRSKVMAGKPQRKGTVVQLFERAPKKPNSARRRCCRVKLNETGQMVQAFIPGEGHRLQKHAIVLVKGGPVKDLIGLKLKVIRGALDCSGVEGRQTRRSIYGSKRSS